MNSKKVKKSVRRLLHRVVVVVSALGLTLVFFLVLPLMQSITQPPTDDMVVTSVDTGTVEPPPPPPEEEPEEDEQEEEKPPELTEDAPPLDLNQLEFALNPGFNDGFGAGDFAIKINTGGNDSDDASAVFAMADLDQRPRVIYQPSPNITAKMRKKAPGTVHIIFIVNEQGRVINPIVQKSSNPVFDRAALTAIKRWKFEPGKRNGKAVRFRMRVPITFPKG